MTTLTYGVELEFLLYDEEDSKGNTIANYKRKEEDSSYDVTGDCESHIKRTLRIKELDGESIPSLLQIHFQGNFQNSVVSSTSMKKTHY